MNKEYLIKWAKAAGIRALKTMAQTAIASLSVSTMITEVNVVAVLSTTALAGLLSILTSVKGLPEVDCSDVKVESEDK